jgi:hypothetical protein
MATQTIFIAPTPLCYCLCIATLITIPAVHVHNYPYYLDTGTPCIKPRYCYLLLLFNYLLFLSLTFLGIFLKLHGWLRACK